MQAGLVTSSHRFPCTTVQGGLLIGALLLLIVEALYLSLKFDSYTLLSRAAELGSSGVGVFILGHLGATAKVLIIFPIILCLLLKDRYGVWLSSLFQQLSPKTCIIFLCVQCICFFLLVSISSQIFTVADLGSLGSKPQRFQYFPHHEIIYVWLACSILSMMFWLFAIIKPALLFTFIRVEASTLLKALLLSLIVWGMALITQSSWSSLGDYTFILSSQILSLLSSEPIVMNPLSRDLGLGQFVVNIAPVCSGYEGIGLMLAFTAIYLYLYRAELIFPQALLLFPIGAVVIWLLNSVRIAFLILIGHQWSAEIAVGGFHSQAGWLAFIITSLGLLWFASVCNFFSKSVDDVNSFKVHNSKVINAILIPFIALLGAAILSKTFTQQFDWLYPMRVILPVLALYWCWSSLSLNFNRPRFESVLIGAIVAIMWIFMLGENIEYNQTIRSSLQELPLSLAIAWIVCRCVGAAFIIPIVEELAFRGYLLSTLARVNVSLHGKMVFSLPAVILSSLAFGWLHGAWIAGTLAGVCYALVRLRSQSIIDPIIAHGITNGLLVVYVMYSGNWSVL